MCHGQLLSQKMIEAARKRHQCDACSKFVEKGMSYVRTTAIVEGDFQSSKICPKCQAMLDAFLEMDHDGDYCFSLRDLRYLVKSELYATGMWGKFRAAFRKALTLGPQGTWHT